MRLVLDTNIFVSALLLPHSVPADLVKPWLAGCFSVITAQDQVDEIARATRHSKIRERLRPAIAGHLVNQLRSRSTRHRLAALSSLFDQPTQLSARLYCQRLTKIASRDKSSTSFL